MTSPNDKPVGDGGPAFPLYPYTDAQDERAKGVVLLDGDEHAKTTAERLGSLAGISWRITDWEAVEYEGEPHWFARSWYTIPGRHIAMLAMLAARTQP